MSDEDEAVRRAARAGFAAAVLSSPFWGLVMLLIGRESESGAVLSWDLIVAFVLFKEEVVVTLLLMVPVVVGVPLAAVVAAVLVGAAEEGIFDDEVVVSTPLERADIGIAVWTLATHRCFAL